MDRMYFLEWDGTYHETFSDIEEHLACKDHPDILTIYECDRVHLEAPAVEVVVEDLMEDFWFRLEGVRSYCRNWTTAEAIADHCLESFYDDVEVVGVVPGCEGIEALQRAIDSFYFWNRPLFWLFGLCDKYCRPERIAIGLDALRCALKEFELVNREKHVLFYPNYKRAHQFVVLAETALGEGVGDE